MDLFLTLYFKPDDYEEKMFNCLALFKNDVVE
jgi:hypothetical protein